MELHVKASSTKESMKAIKKCPHMPTWVACTFCFLCNKLLSACSWLNYFWQGRGLPGISCLHQWANTLLCQAPDMSWLGGVASQKHLSPCSYSFLQLFPAVPALGFEGIIKFLAVVWWNFVFSLFQMFFSHCNSQTHRLFVVLGNPEIIAWDPRQRLLWIFYQLY